MYTQQEKDLIHKLKTKYISPPKLKENIQNTNIIINYGKFNSKEDQLFHSKVTEYLTKNNLQLIDLKNYLLNENDFPFRDLATFIALQLNYRTLYTVTYKIKRMYHPYYGKIWTDEEKNDLLKFVANHGCKWDLIKRKFKCELENGRSVLRWLIKKNKKENKCDCNENNCSENFNINYKLNDTTDQMFGNNYYSCDCWCLIDYIGLLGYSLIYNYFYPNFIMKNEFEDFYNNLQTKFNYEDINDYINYDTVNNRLNDNNFNNNNNSYIRNFRNDLKKLYENNNDKNNIENNNDKNNIENNNDKNNTENNNDKNNIENNDKNLSIDDILFSSIKYKCDRFKKYSLRYLIAKYKILIKMHNINNFNDIYNLLLNLILTEIQEIENLRNIKIIKEKYKVI